jgi:hypothetical protein
MKRIREMSRSRNHPLTAAAVVLLAGLSTSELSQAALVTLVGTDFNVVYDTTQLGLFGTPQLVGDYLVFTPNAFDAQSLNGAGTDTVNSLASGIQLVAHTGYQFGNLSEAAVGDYLMQGTGTLVSVAGTFQATAAANPLTQTTVNLSVSGPLNIADGQTHNWTAGASITNSTPTDTPGYNPWLAQASTINVQLADTLMATTTRGSGGSQAFIQEKFGSVELVVDPVAVPLPGSAWLSLCGLAALARFIPLRRRVASGGIGNVKA